MPTTSEKYVFLINRLNSNILASHILCIWFTAAYNLIGRVNQCSAICENVTLVLEVESCTVVHGAVAPWEYGIHHGAVASWEYGIQTMSGKIVQHQCNLTLMSLFSNLNCSFSKSKIYSCVVDLKRGGGIPYIPAAR